MPQKVEEKIRYLCRKFPTLEWSGVLFTSYTGNFEDGSLEITCEDLFPMDFNISSNYHLKVEIIAEAIQKKILVVDTELYKKNFK